MKNTVNSIFDVVIVGAGPSGAIAAYQLARHGLSVAVLEKATFPRYKTCGGGLVHRSLKWLPCPLRDCVESECFRILIRFLGSDLEFEVSRPIPIVSMTMRSAFDYQILEEALTAGVRLFENTLCQKVTVAEDWAEVESPRSTYRGRFVLAADGVNSQVARSLNWSSQPFAVPALEWELAVPTPTLDQYANHAVFDFNATEAGYGWVFPKRTHLSVGILSTRQGTRRLRRALEDYLRLIGIPFDQPIRKSGHQIPIRPRVSLSRARVLLLGDAAGLAEPLTGEGISLAIQSGLLAAQALIENDMRSTESEKAYASQVKHQIGRELKWGRAVAALTYRYPKLRDSLFRRQGQRLCEMMTDIFMGDSSYRSLALRPGNYLKLLRRFPGSS